MECEGCRREIRCDEWLCYIGSKELGLKWWHMECYGINDKPGGSMTQNESADI